MPVTPNSSLAFDILVNFCLSEGLEVELVTGIASILLLTSRNAPSPSFAPPVVVPIASAVSPPRAKDVVLRDLYRSIDKFLTLSSTQDALDSLICSSFFDPSIPCNFIGAASLGVRKALSTADEIDNQQPNSHVLSINSSEVSLTTWSKNLSIASLALRTFCGGLMKLKIIDSSTKFYVNSIKLHSVALSQTVKHELKTGAPSDAYYLGGLSSIYQIYFGRLGHIGIRALNRSMLKL